MESVEDDTSDDVFVDSSLPPTSYEVLNWCVAGDCSIYRGMKDGDDPGDAFGITTSSRMAPAIVSITGWLKAVGERILRTGRSRGFNAQ